MTTHRGGGGELIASLDFMLRVALIPRGLIGNLSTDDGDARDDAKQKVDLTFTLEFC